MRHELVLFDFDGTLADSLGWVAGAMDRLAVRMNLPRMSPEALERYRESSPASIMSGMGIPLWKIPRIVTEMRRMMNEDIGTIRLFPGVEEFVHRMRGCGVKLGVVSSNSEENVRRVLGPELAGQFVVMGCGASILGKPPKLRRAAREAGVPLERTLYVGDELRDLEASAKAGMEFAAAGWGFTRPETFRARAPLAVFLSIAEMSDYLAAGR
jgi:phosphoglycolate phosphatase